VDVWASHVVTYLCNMLLCTESTAGAMAAAG